MNNDEFVQTLQTLTVRHNHECFTYGTDVVAAFYDYCSIVQFVQARLPGFQGKNPTAFQRIVYWTMDIGDGGDAAKEVCSPRMRG